MDYSFCPPFSHCSQEWFTYWTEWSNAHFHSVTVGQQIPVHKWNTLFIEYIHKCHVPVCLVWSWTSASPFSTASSHSDSKHRLVQWRAYTFSRSNNWYAIYMLMYANDMLFAHAIVSLWKQREATKASRSSQGRDFSERKIYQCTEVEWFVLFCFHNQNTTTCQWGHWCVSWSGLPSQSIMLDSYGFVILWFKLMLLLQITYLSKKPSLKKGPKMGILPTPPPHRWMLASKQQIPAFSDAGEGEFLHGHACE